MNRIVADTQGGVVSLTQKRSSRSFRGQWVVFYTALALQGKSSSCLDAQELQLLGPWFLKKPESVGKEVARHLHDLSRCGLADLISHEGRTKRWRLNIPAENIELLPSPEHCEAWLRQQQWDLLGGIEKIPRSIGPWLSCITKATIRMQQGRIPEGLEFIQAAKRQHTDSTLLQSIAELLDLRLYARIGEYPEPGAALQQDIGGIGKALLIRAGLAQALAPEFDNLDLAIETLRRQTLRLGNLPDINGLGTAYNVLGVLFRRRGELKLAERYLRYAAALLAASSDLPTLQAAIFNLGHTLYELATSEEDLRESLELIKLDREICSSLGMGKDSAQAEIVAGSVCLRLGDIEQALCWLGEGQRIVEVLKSDYNRAGVLRLHAEILWAQARGERQILTGERKAAILSKFQEACTFLQRAGFPTDSVEHEMALVRRGELPKWLPKV